MHYWQQKHFTIPSAAASHKRCVRAVNSQSHSAGFAGYPHGFCSSHLLPLESSLGNNNRNGNKKPELKPKANYPTHPSLHPLTSGLLLNVAGKCTKLSLDFCENQSSPVNTLPVVQTLLLSPKRNLGGREAQLRIPHRGIQPCPKALSQLLYEFYSRQDVQKEDGKSSFFP